MIDIKYLKALSSTDKIIDDARNGKMYILVDEADRENEGDLIIPAQMVSPENINVLVAGGAAGAFSSIIPLWTGGNGTRSVTKAIRH